MDRQRLRWILAFGLLAIALIVLLPLKDRITTTPFVMPILLLSSAVTLFYARSFLRRFPASRGRWVVTKSTVAWSNILAIAGALFIVAAFCWVIVGINLVPNTEGGAAALFVPSLVLGLSGVAFVGFRVALWVFGVTREDGD